LPCYSDDFYSIVIEDFSVNFKPTYEQRRRRRKMNKAVSGVTLTLMILTSMLMLAFSAKPVRAWTGTVYIQADGTINPSSAPIIN
jgi:hypothetical protein